MSAADAREDDDTITIDPTLQKRLSIILKSCAHNVVEPSTKSSNDASTATGNSSAINRKDSELSFSTENYVRDDSQEICEYAENKATDGDTRMSVEAAPTADPINSVENVKLKEEGELDETGSVDGHDGKKKRSHRKRKYDTAVNSSAEGSSLHKHKRKHKHKHKEKEKSDKKRKSKHKEKDDQKSGERSSRKSKSKHKSGEKRRSKSDDRASKSSSSKRHLKRSTSPEKASKEDDRQKRAGSFWRGYSQLPSLPSDSSKNSRKNANGHDSKDEDDPFWSNFSPPAGGWRSPSRPKDIAACDFLPVDQIPLPPRRGVSVGGPSEPRNKRIEIRMHSKPGPDRHGLTRGAAASQTRQLGGNSERNDPALKFLTSLCKTISERDREEERRARRGDVKKSRFDREAGASRFRAEILSGTNVAGPHGDGSATVPPWLLPAHTQVAVARANQDALKQQFPVSTGEEHKVVVDDVVATAEVLESDEDLDAIQQVQKETVMDRQIHESLGQFTRHKPLWLPEQTSQAQALSEKEKIGKRLLEKMGWTEGTGLGRNRDGPLEPLKLDVKLDRKGLLSNEEIPHEVPLPGLRHVKTPDFKLIAVTDPVVAAPPPAPAVATDPDTEVALIPGPSAPKTSVSRWDDIPGAPAQKCVVVASKHPISVLYELCQKNKWPPPLITERHDQLGFYAVVTLNNREFRGDYARNKKQARTNCAISALESLGFVPPGLQWAA